MVDTCRSWNIKNIEGKCEKKLLEEMKKQCYYCLKKERILKAETITDENKQYLVKESILLREKIRGETIGKLG